MVNAAAALTGLLVGKQYDSVAKIFILNPYPDVALLKSKPRHTAGRNGDGERNAVMWIQLG